MKHQKINDSGTLSEVLAVTTKRIDFLEKKAESIEHEQISPPHRDWFADFSLKRLPLH